MVLGKKEVVLLELNNQREEPLKLWIEPWCEELELPPKVAWRLTAVGANPDTSMVTVEFQIDQTVVYGIPDAVMRIYVDGDPIWECFEPFSLPR